MRETLAGTGTLVRLGLRRDRWLLSLWILAFAAMAGSSASAGAGLFPVMASRIAAAQTINATASMVALFGRVYDPTSLGALSMIKYTAFMTAVLALLMVFVTIRHTRADEESGQLELLSGGRLGRNAPLAAALVISFGASLVLGLARGGALAATGLPGYRAAGSLFVRVRARLGCHRHGVQCRGQARRHCHGYHPSAGTSRSAPTPEATGGCSSCRWHCAPPW